MSSARVWLHRLCWLLLLVAAPAWSHKGSDAYLDVRQLEASGSATAALAGSRQLRFTLAVAIKDLDLLLPLDADSDGKVTWGEVKAATAAVTALAGANVSLEPAVVGAGSAAATAPACQLDWKFDGLDRRGDGTYIRLTAQTACPATQAVALRYTLLREQDANHRLLVAGRVDGRDLLTTASPLQAASLVLAAGGRASGTAAAGAPSVPAGWAALRHYFTLGVQHLLLGYDHLAFLLALVLPLRLVLFRAAPATVSPGGLADDRGGRSLVWWALLRTVTAFTIGHSITLVLATLGWTPVSPRWVEPAIALTIVVTALLNLRPLAWVRTDVLALLFGMVHGIGFAGLLQEAAAPSGLLAWALAGFNLGVEAGQLVAVAAWVLLCQPAVRAPWYDRVVVRAGSMLLVLLACWWFWQRVQ